MAGADYRLCDLCDRKVFYDAGLSYEYDEVNVPRRVGNDDPSEVAVGDLGDWAVLCKGCAETHRTAIIDEQRALDAWNGVRAEGSER